MSEREPQTWDELCYSVRSLCTGDTNRDAHSAGFVDGVSVMGQRLRNLPPLATCRAADLTLEACKLAAVAMDGIKNHCDCELPDSVGLSFERATIAVNAAIALAEGGAV